VKLNCQRLRSLYEDLDILASKVAIVRLRKNADACFQQALDLIGGIDDLNSRKRPVVIKPGIFDHRKPNHATVGVTRSIASAFNKAPRVFLAESDNYRGTGTERLRIYKRLLSGKVSAFNLSEDIETRETVISGEKMPLSHILFKPNVLVSVHVLRKYERGAVVKNLFGLVPVREKARFHRKLTSVLLDLYEAVGGIDLAILDGTYIYASPSSQRRIKANIMLAGRDAIAVEAVGSALMGMKPEKMLIVREAVKRGLGEGDLTKIEVVGISLEETREEIARKKKLSGT
jgi:uncharacterized protein (DUF362 family)